MQYAQAKKSLRGMRVAAATWRGSLRAGLFLTSGLLLGSAVQAAACSGITKTLFAAPDGMVANDGSAWSTATTLKGALLKAEATTAGQCVEIRLKQGVYKTSDTNDRAANFSINRPLRLKGGYTGVNDTDRLALADAAVGTVLSGDLGGGLNAYHVMVVGGNGAVSGNGLYKSTDAADASYTLIEGVTITGGKANGTGQPDSSGGGLYCNGIGSAYECSPAINHVIFKNNSSTGPGGALMNYAFYGKSSPTITNAEFSGNSAGGNGGAIANYGSGGGISSPDISNTIFSNNSSNGSGGAICNYTQSGESRPIIKDTSFNTNTAAKNGGAMFSESTIGKSNPTLIGVTFTENTASQGGAMYNYGNKVSGSVGESSPIIENSTFERNRATAGHGGAVYNKADTTSSPSFKNTTFNGNVAELSGGAIYNDAVSGISSPIIGNSTFVGNKADTGGAIHNNALNSTSQMLIAGSTFSANTANSGGTFYNAGAGSVQLRASIVWGSAASSIALISNSGGANPAISDSIVQGSGGSANWKAALGTDGGNNLDADPVLGALQNNGGPTQTLMPGAGSAAIDQVDCHASNMPATDQRGIARPQGARCDVGAVEAKQYQLSLGAQAAAQASGSITAVQFPVGQSVAPVCAAASCGPFNYPEGSTITLTAQAGSGSVFTGWSEPACAATSLTCNVTLSQASQSVTVSFGAVTLAVDPPASGVYGTAYSQQLNLTPAGGTAPYSYAATGLPSSASLSPAGLLTAPANLPAGAYHFTVAAIDANGVVSQSASATLNIAKAAQTMSIGAAPSNPRVGGSHTIAAQAGASSAPLVIVVTGACSNAGNVVSFDAVGTCTIAASQSGDANYLEAAPAQLVVTVAQGGSSVTVGSSANPSQLGKDVTFTLSVAFDASKRAAITAKSAPVPTGTVQLSDGATVIGTADLVGGSASITVAMKTAGTHSLVASYGGDANYSAQTSDAFMQTVSAEAVSATPVPTLAQWALLVLSLVLGGVALPRLRGAAGRR